MLWSITLERRVFSSYQNLPILFGNGGSEFNGEKPVLSQEEPYYLDIGDDENLYLYSNKGSKV